ncbi:MAG: hypothetical protein OWQ57_02220 [Sulfobacillus sp.]|nr:hypothetical protein [Sulfobacillus sp.]
MSHRHHHRCHHHHRRHYDRFLLLWLLLAPEVRSCSSVSSRHRHIWAGNQSANA